MTTRRLHTAVTAAVLTAALVATGAAATPRAPGAGADPGAGSPVTTARPVAEATVTLVTGDRAALTRSADGRQSVTVEPAARDGYRPVFEAYDDGGELYVIPSDVAGLVPDVLDRELFNVTKLADNGYHDGVPVIATYDDAAAGPRTQAGIASVSRLGSLDAVTATINGTGRWWRATGAAGAEKVWLDEMVEVSLDQSVPEVGADQAWQQGYDGSGVTVAVLDTGVDTTHPDLAGTVVGEANFSSSDTVRDVNGHGTHVAGTIVGSGAASDSTYVGVAPGAELLSGKVLGDDGRGRMSDLIQGMEWAVDQGADLVNISLGSEPTDGTDPASLAVDQLTAEHDALFVIAAGNTGPADFTVTSPGTASAALTVGADDSLAIRPISARGPRLGDHHIKPDIIAPGMNIVAPRAGGSTLGPVVDEHYMRLTGTSMAAPHAAGAAAIRLQQEPELGAAALKASLAGTADPYPNQSVYRQGGGRLYIPSALDAPVRTDRATLDFGYLRYPHEDAEPTTTDLTYTNRTDQPVTLDLSLEVTSEEGAVPPATMLSVTPATITVQPGADATVTVTLAATTGESGLYGGYLAAARDGQVVTRTGVGFHKEPESYDLVLNGVTADGRTPTIGVEIMDVVDRRELFRIVSFEGDTATVRIPPGTYSVMGNLYLYDDDTLTDIVVVGDPEVTVTEDTTVALDATAASPVTVDTPGQEVAPSGMLQATYRRIDDRPGSTPYSRTTLAPVTGPDTPQISVMATDPITLGEFDYFTHMRLREPGKDPSPVLYDLMLPETGQIPSDLHYELDPAELATIENRFHGGVAGHPMGEVRHGWRPWQTSSYRVAETVPAGTARTEYVVAGDTLYRQQVTAGGIRPSQGRLFEPDVHYQPGTSHEQSWFRPVVRPGLPQGTAAAAPEPVYRIGDTLRLQLAEWVDDQPGHWGERAVDYDTTAFRLYRDGELIGQAERPQGTFAMSPEPATYRMELDVARDAEWWTTSVATHTAWTMRSAPPDGDGQELLPLLLVDYDVEADLLNTAPHPRDRRGPSTVELDVQHQPGADGPAVEGARLWISYDDGATWRERPGRHLDDGRFRFILDSRGPGDTAGYASLRVEAWDVNGNRIEQEVTRAWRIAAR